MKVLVRYIGTGLIFCRIESPSRTNTRYAYESFSKVYWDRVYFLQNRESVRTNTRYAYERFSKVYWDRVYFLQNRESVRTNTRYAYERFSKVYWDRVYFLQNRESVRTNTRYAYESFSKVIWDRVYFWRAEWFATGSGFRPPAAPPSPRPNESRVPPSPPPPEINQWEFEQNRATARNTEVTAFFQIFSGHLREII